MTPRPRALTLSMVALAGCLALAPARAEAQAPAAADALVRAQEAESAARPKDAVELYRQVVQADPSSRLAHKAEARLAWLEARGEGDYAPLAVLLRVQHLRREALTEDEVTRLDQQARAFPAGRVRSEALALVADAYLRRLDRPREALSAYRLWSEQPGINAAERELAESGVALSLARLGELGASLEGLSDAGLLGRPEAVYLRVQALTRVLRPAAWLCLALFVGAAAALGAFSRSPGAALRLAFSPRRLALAAYVLAPPLLLVRLYELTELPRFAGVVGALAAALALVSFVGAGLRGRPLAPRTRRVVASLGGLATLAAGLLALDHFELLLSIGLAGLRPGG